MSPRWDVELYASTLVAHKARFDTMEPDGLHYETELYVTGRQLTDTLRHNARGHWPDGAWVETPRVMTGRTYADGVQRGGHEILHHVKLRFVLVADEMPPPEAWGGWRLRHFDKTKSEA